MFCIVCTVALTKRQRLYCSRKCNHRAEATRRKLREAQAAATKLEAAVGVTQAQVLNFDAQVKASALPSGRSLVAVEHDGCATTFIYAPPPTTSLWQRIRKRVADAWHKFIFLIGEHASN